VTSRRAFVVTLAAGIVAPRGGALAQARGNVPRVGYVGGSLAPAETFRKALRDLGYVEAQTVHLDLIATGPGAQPKRYNDAIVKFVRQPVDVIVAANPHALEIAIKATRTIPIVGLDLESDPVARRWVTSLARPGGNMTGIFLDIPEMSGKQLQFLREGVPKLERVAILGDPQVNDLQFKATEAAARAVRLTTERFTTTNLDGIAIAFKEAGRWRADGVVALTSPLMFAGLRQVAEASAKHRIATICPFVPEFAEAGGLLAYGPVFLDLYRRLAGYVDQIVKGAKPADLPIQRPEKFELVINLKTARALKLELPQSLVLRADHVIE
jgi:ABC-type uncharacterized transport system substrate-binding protein